MYGYGYGYYGFDWTYVLLIIGMLLSLAASTRLKSTFSYYRKIRSASGLTGAETAERILRAAGITDVHVRAISGSLTDHYDPRTKTVSLSEDIYDKTSLAAVGVAAHECGHAVQHAREYAPLKMRSALVPIVQCSSMWSTWVIIAGILVMNTFPALCWIGLAMIAMSALFSLITLPVEYNASARAMDWLESTHTLVGEQVGQARIALSWAARTYLVAALSAIATLIYYLGFARRD